MNKRVGLLLPKSVIYPTVSFDIMGGLRHGLADAGVQDVEIKTESIGVGADYKLIYASCEKLLFDGCSVIAGYINPAAAEKLEPLFAGANAVFLSLDSGYHFPSTTDKLPHVFYISLQGALCCRVAAKTAIADGNKRFAFTCSFYDAGYRSPLAFTSGIQEEGGEITFNYITKLKRSEFTLAPLMQHLQANSEDAVLASFCGDMMQDFCAAAAGNVLGNHAIYGAPFMGEEQWLAQCVYPGTDIKTCVPWASHLDNGANQHFKKVMAANKQRVNIFSLLGWEASLMAAAALNATDTEKGIEILEGMAYPGPRGEVIIDAATHQSYAPVYNALNRKNEETGNCMLVPVNASPYTEEQRKKLITDINNFAGGASSSWHNAYACLDS